MGKNSMPDGVKTVIYWALGLGILAFIALILLILFGNLSGNSGISKLNVNVTVSSNETLAFVNSTGVTLSGYNSSWSGITALRAFNTTDDTEILIANLTISSLGVVTNASNMVWEADDSAYLTYFYTHTYTSDSELGVESIITNFSESQTNMSKQFSTVGIILGVALLLVILIGVLIFAIRKLMGAAGSTGGSTGGYGRGGGLDSNGSIG